jgi:hypothetical protein
MTLRMRNLRIMRDKPQDLLQNREKIIKIHMIIIKVSQMKENRMFRNRRRANNINKALLRFLNQ